MGVGLWRIDWTCSFFYHKISVLRVEVISARLSHTSEHTTEPHIPVPYWSGKENWAESGLLEFRAAGGKSVHSPWPICDQFFCLLCQTLSWINLLESVFLTPHLVWVPGGYGHPGVCRETWLNKFQAPFVVLGAVPCPSQLLSAPSAAFAFCAALRWWCQGWLHLLSLSFCNVPYAWNILLALSQETTFFLPPSVKLISSTTPIRWADTG